MAGTWHWYGNGLLNVLKGAIDLDTDSFKIMLTTSTYTPDIDTHDFRNDVTNEVGASGTYASGGGACTVSVSYDTASNEIRVLLSDVAFTGATITARTAVLYKARGGASSADELVAYCTEASDVTSTAGTFTVDNPATQSLKITVA
jgi:hypothetical protein